MMYFFENYFNSIVKYDFINKFWYYKSNKIPKICTIQLNFGCKKSNTKQLATTLLALEIVSSKKGNLFLKIQKGYPVGCKIILHKKLMYNFFTKLIFEIFPKFKTILQINKKKVKYDNSFSYKLKNNLLFIELQHNYHLFNHIVTDLTVTIVGNKTSQKEFFYLANSFKQPIKLRNHLANVTQLVECNLAKIKVKGSNPFFCLCFVFS